MIEAAFVGFFTSLGLILAIGAQNAFVLRCGLRHQHIFTVCAICAVSDALLITLGVLGLGELIRLAPWLERLAFFAGIGFVSVYGFLRFRAFLYPPSAKSFQQNIPSLGQTVLMTLGFTWLNPHVYVDTVFLIGAISRQFSHNPTLLLIYSVFAALASLSFFFALGYSAKFFAPVFHDPKRWRYIDLGIGLIMVIIAIQLSTAVLIAD